MRTKGLEPFYLSMACRYLQRILLESGVYMNGFDSIQLLWVVPRITHRLLYLVLNYY
jgi:hypothetical protein